MIDDRKWAMGRIKLEAFQNNLPPWLYEPEVAEYHQIVDLLEQASGESLTQFRIQDSQMKQQVLSMSFGTRRRPGRVEYGEKKQCPPDLMRRQLEGLLAYLDVLQSRERGYRVTER